VNQRLAILLAMAMFVLVVDTSLMNVSISSVVEDLDTTVSGVQSAIALEALVSAAFILIGSKVGDLIGRKRAYVLGLLGYAIGALAMALAQSLIAIIIFWAIIGGLGASMLLPAMQSLIHGNFEGPAEKKAYAEKLLADEPKEIQAEILSINTDARHRALQVALLVPILAGLAGLFNSFRMMRLPDPIPSAAAEGMAFG
jgi:MFS family permease